jgi:hypothetical protein
MKWDEMRLVHKIGTVFYIIFITLFAMFILVCVWALLTSIH